MTGETSKWRNHLEEKGLGCYKVNWEELPLGTDLGKKDELLQLFRGVGESWEGLGSYSLGWEELESENSNIDNEGWLMGILMGGKIFQGVGARITQSSIKQAEKQPISA